MLIKDLPPFQQWSTWKTFHWQQSKNFWELEWFPSLFSKRLKIKFLHPIRRSMKMLFFKMRNLKELKNDIFNQQSWGFFQSSVFRSSYPEVLYKKVVFNNLEKFKRKTHMLEPFLKKVASLILSKIDSGTRVFLQIL